MAHQKVSMSLAMILVTMLWSYVASQSDDCTNEIISMSPCLNFISGNSSSPSTACCSQLNSVVGSQPRCLCQVLSGGVPNLGFSINQTKALAMPKACNIETPPVSKCQADSPSDSPSTPNSPSKNPSGGGGSKVVPTPGDGSSNAASSPNLAHSMMFLCVFLMSFVSAFSTV